MNRIHDFLQKLERTRRRLTGDELDTLYGLAHYPDPTVRSGVAVLLADHYEQKSEEALLRLSLDKSGSVRADAADSLCIARSEAAAQRLLLLAASDPDTTVRGLSVHSTYDVFVNRLGDSDETLGALAGILRPMLEAERDKWVSSCYHCVLYLCGEKDSLHQLLDFLDDEDWCVRGSVLEAFEDILDDDNEAAIEDALQYYLPFEENETLSARMEELLLLIEENKSGRIW